MNIVEMLILGAALDIVQTRFCVPTKVMRAAWQIVMPTRQSRRDRRKSR